MVSKIRLLIFCLIIKTPSSVQNCHEVNQSRTLPILPLFQHIQAGTQIVLIIDRIIIVVTSIVQFVKHMFAILVQDFPLQIFGGQE